MEAKYRSPKSSEEDETVVFEERKTWQRDQLSRKLEDLHDPETYKRLRISEKDVVSKRLIYLTNDTLLPENDIVSGIKHSNSTSNEVYWLAWKSFYEAACMAPETEQDKLLLTHIQKVCGRKNLTRFYGWREMQSVSSVKKLYHPSSRLVWPIKTIGASTWEYKGGEMAKNE